MRAAIFQRREKSTEMAKSGIAQPSLVSNTSSSISKYPPTNRYLQSIPFDLFPWEPAGFGGCIPLLNSVHSLAFSSYRNIQFCVFLRKKIRLSLPELAQKGQNSPANNCWCSESHRKTFLHPWSRQGAFALRSEIWIPNIFGSFGHKSLPCPSGSLWLTWDGWKTVGFSVLGVFLGMHPARTTPPNHGGCECATPNQPCPVYLCKDVRDSSCFA